MVKKIFLISILLGVITGSLAPAAFAVPVTDDYVLIDGIRYSPGQEIIELRTRTSKTTWLGGDRYALDASIGSMHYKNDPDDPNELWKDIETDIKTSPKPDWYCEVVKGNWHLLIDHDTTVALGKDGHWIGFRYEGIAYLDWATKEYVILLQRQDVTPIVEGNKITWPGIFYGADLEYIYTPDGFKENLIVSQATRDWLTANPPSSYGLNNATTYIGGYLEVDWKNAYPAEDYFGNPINWDNANDFADSGVFWRHPVKDKIITALPLGWARHDQVAPEDWVKLRLRFYKTENKNWLLFGAKVTDLNQYPEGKIIIDPTVDEQVGASADDASQATDDSVSITKLFGYTDSTTEHVGNRFINITVPQGATIDTATFSFFMYGSAADEPKHQLRGELSANAAAFTTDSNNIDARSRTTATIDWDSNPLGATGDDEWEWGAPVGDPTNGADIKTIIQEIVDQGSWASGNALVLIYEQHSESSSFDLAQRTWDYNDHSYAAKLHIEYSGGGPSAPTVVTNAASSVEETTVTLSGNITATGGENCTDRGFQWDIDSGVPYASNWTEQGDYGICNFTHGLTSLTKGELYYYRAGANNSAGWGWGSEVTFLTKPDEPTSLTDTARTATQITLTWTPGAGSDNTTIRYRTDQYPTDYNDGTLGYSGGASTCNVTGLSSGQIHYFRAWSYAIEGALEQYSDTYSQDIAYTLPGDPSNFATSNPQKTSLDLDWTKGAGDNLTMVRRKTGSYPTDYTDGDQAYFNSGNSTTDSGLDANTTYYYRAWAYDSESGYYSSSYSQDTGTTAMPDAPTVTTANATDITDTTATLNGNITDTGDQNADTRGFEWGSACDNYTDNWTEGGSFGTGAFSHGISSLSANTTYYFRAMAHNDGGWGYGTCANFTTSSPAPPGPAVLGAPTNLVAVYVSDFQIDLSWQLGTNADSTMIRGKYGSYPIDRNDGYQVYYGSLTSYSDRLVDLQLRETDVYYRAWSENATASWSSGYAQTSIGGVGLTNLIQLLATALIIWLAFWRRGGQGQFLYFVACPVAITFGLGWYDMYQTGAGMAMAIVLAAIGLYMLVLGIMNLTAR